jgi:hypothetical protein
MILQVNREEKLLLKAKGEAISASPFVVMLTNE